MSGPSARVIASTTSVRSEPTGARHVLGESLVEELLEGAELAHLERDARRHRMAAALEEEPSGHRLLDAPRRCRRPAPSARSRRRARPA